MATLSEVDRFAGFFGMLGYKLEPFQRKIVEEVFSPRRETLILLPRANGKSTLLAGIGLWSLLRGKGSQIVVGAASREQAATLPASWLTPEGLAEQNDAVHELAWQRYHLNVWTGGEAPWILPDEWDQNAGEPEIEGEGYKVIGIDAAVSSDTAALALVRRDPEEIYHVVWRVWTPTKRDKVPLADVEAVTREWAKRHQVDAIVYDPRFFEHAAQNLEDEGLPVREWTYKRNAAAAGTLHEIVSHGRLRHGGADLPRQHALAAEIRSREFGEVISKTRSREHIDCLMALCYAADMAAALKPKRQSIYETRNLAGA